MLTVAGSPVPGMLLLEVVGSTGAVAPGQIDERMVKVGVTIGVTVIAMVTGAEH